MQVPVLSARGLYTGSKNMTCGTMTCEMNNLEIEWKFVFSPEVSLCGWLGSKHRVTKLNFSVVSSALLPLLLNTSLKLVNVLHKLSSQLTEIARGMPVYLLFF